MQKQEKIEQKNIIRLLSTDLDSSLPLISALRRIKGIGFMFSNAICNHLGLDPKIKIGSLSDEQIKKVEETIKNPQFYPWLLNRRKDPRTGKDMHIVSGDIPLKLREDISLLKKIRCYRGIRHELGLPVRGQRTGGGSFRKGKTVGVVRKKAVTQQKK
ncbi:MAG: 30S ribosomal protein S13 [Candidatus Aenigmatarchaeota archaeon]